MLRTIEHILAWVFAILLPVQARIIVFQSDWFFNEYLAMALYATDLLLAALLIVWILRERHTLRFPRGWEWFLPGLLAVAILSLFFAQETAIGWYRFVKLLEGVLLFFYIRSRGVQSILPALVVGGVLQAVLGSMQFLIQSDLGLQVIGESVLSPNFRGVAVFLNAAGEKVLRAYGLTPHPNVLAACLAVAIAALYTLTQQAHRASWLYIAYAILLFGFFATFSRVAIGAWVLACGGLLAAWRYSLWRIDTRKLGVLVAITIGMTLLFAVIFWHAVVGRFQITQSDEAVMLRNYYNTQALHSSSGVNWFGVGIGNFVPWLTKQAPNLPTVIYQPAHNLYLLVYAELGLVGVALLIGLLGSLGQFLWRTRRLPQGVALVGLALVAGFDHYFWTLQQGIFIFWLSLGAVAHSVKNSYHTV